MKKGYACIAPHSYCGHSRPDCQLVPVTSCALMETKKNLEDEVLSILAGNKEFDDARSAANAELIQILAQFLRDYPSQRFGQALNNLDLATDDCGMAEPQTQLARAKAALKRMKK